MIIVLSLIGLFCVFMFINYLDRWSTSTLFKYNKMMIYKNEDRDTWLKDTKEKGLTQNEMNTFARVFMNKFGIEKGMKIFTIVWNIPWLVAIILGVYFEFISWNFVSIMLAFYIGALYVQIMRAIEVRKRIKRLGIKL